MNTSTHAPCRDVSRGPADLIIVMVAILLSSSLTMAQSFNIDLDASTSPPALGGGVPAPAYPAAGSQPGVWNSYASTSGPVSLVNLAGGGTSATLAITSTSTTISTLGFNNANNTGDFALLMNDAQQVGTSVQGGSRTYTFAGLSDGPYSVFTYASPPQPGNNGECFITIPGSNEGQLMTASPHVGNTFALGVTHVRHTLNVIGGTFNVNITDIAGAPAAYVSGFQLTVVPEPSSLGALCLLAAPLVARVRSRRK